MIETNNKHNIYNYGFTGTKNGMTDKQKKTLKKILETSGNNFIMHHGDCIGADEEAHNITIKERKYIKVVIHPPINTYARAHCKTGKVEILDSKKYLERNYDIVNSSDILIACPKGNKEILRSGTWATIRYARKLNKEILLILIDGSIKI